MTWQHIYFYTALVYLLVQYSICVLESFARMVFNGALSGWLEALGLFIVVVSGCAAIACISVGNFGDKLL